MAMHSTCIVPANVHEPGQWNLHRDAGKYVPLFTLRLLVRGPRLLWFTNRTQLRDFSNVLQGISENVQIQSGSSAPPPHVGRAVCVDCGTVDDTVSLADADI